MSLRIALTLARKDLRLFLRDRTALFFAFALPIGLATVMGTALGAAMGGGGSGAKRQAFTIGVEDRAKTEASADLIARLEASGDLRPRVVDDAERAVANGELSSALAIAPDFDPDAVGAARGGLTLYRDPNRQIATQVVVFQLAPILMEQSYGEAFAKVASGEGMSDMLGLEVNDLAPPSRSGLPRNAGASHAFASMAVMMLLFNLVAAAGTLQDERAEGTLDRLRLTPSAGSSVLLGKALVTMSLALVQLAVLFLFGAIVFDVPVFEHAFEVGVISVVWAFTASAIGLTFATACRTRKQLEGLSTLVILGMSAVGGAWFPREITPGWFQTAGLVTPVAWAMDAYEGVLWYGKGFVGTAERDGMALELGVLAAFGVALFAVSAVLYRRRYASG